MKSPRSATGVCDISKTEFILNIGTEAANIAASNPATPSSNSVTMR